MPAWRFPLVLEPGDTLPMFLRVAKAITREIQRGRIAPGTRVPGARALAQQLSIDRGTAAAAYGELVAEGWLTTRERSGTFVTHDLPIKARTAQLPRAGRLGFSLPPLDAGLARFEEDHDAREEVERTVSKNQRMLVMAGGVPDLRLLPTKPLARAYRQALEQRGISLLGYGDPRGQARLRHEIARMLGQERAMTVTADDVLITHGAQESLYLLGQILCAPGDRVAVEALGYKPAWVALGQRARLTALPVDSEGLDVDALGKLARQREIRAVYLTPHHQYPTMATLGISRRIALRELAREHRFAIIEDDYDHEMHYEGRPIVPLASDDPAGVVVYVGTLSKILAPGLRLGYMVAPKPLLARAAALRRGLVRQGDSVLEHAVADLFEDGEIQRHARRIRRHYAVRRRFIGQLLETHLSGMVDVQLPPGGMALWLRTHVDADLWAERAAENGVLVAAGSRFHFDGTKIPFLRVGYAGLDEAELEAAVARLKKAASSRQDRGRRPSAPELRRTGRPRH